MITNVQKYLLNKLPEKLLKHIVVELDSGCWLWQVNINRNGYGRNYEKSKRYMAHITLYKLLKGEYDQSLVLDHVYCTHKNCVNPCHLSPVTTQQNVNRGSGGLFKAVRPFKLPVEEDFLGELLAEYAYIRI